MITPRLIMGVITVLTVELMVGILLTRSMSGPIVTLVLLALFTPLGFIVGRWAALRDAGIDDRSTEHWQGWIEKAMDYVWAWVKKCR